MGETGEAGNRASAVEHLNLVPAADVVEVAREVSLELVVEALHGFSLQDPQMRCAAVCTWASATGRSAA